ncbi:hypothetical protein ACFVAV_22420 [Nocardia sp. NPDC057663]|uniref:hypothetical protein n=1 Tax=Nocardia sp. NPDC057663 TaxID=3346201 RepID=UPI0036723D3F
MQRRHTVDYDHLHLHLVGVAEFARVRASACYTFYPGVATTHHRQHDHGHTTTTGPAR